MKRLPPVSTPPAQRWREFKIRVVPALTLAATAAVIFYLWSRQIAPRTLVGRAEAATADVVSPDAGVLTNLWVTRFQPVRAGDVVAEVASAGSASLEGFLDTLRGRSALAQLEVDPALDRQRAAIDYHRLRLDYLTQRVKLATARVDLRRAKNEQERGASLFEQNLISEDEFDLTEKTAEALQVEVEETEKLVNELERTLGELRVWAGGPGSEESASELLADAQEDRRRLAEWTRRPVALRSPIDGFVTVIHHQAGENIRAGDPIVTITAAEPEQIVGYLSQPFSVEPRPGMRVEVRRRSYGREEGMAEILAVGGQFEEVSEALRRPGAAFELGLPIAVGLPADLALRPGELVDLTVLEN